MATAVRLLTDTYSYSLRNDSGSETKNNIMYVPTGSLVPDVNGNLKISSNHSQDSLVFNDPANGDYSPKAGGPAIDAGLDLGYAYDLLGTPVPQGGAPDIGAQERPQP